MNKRHYNYAVTVLATLSIALTVAAAYVAATLEIKISLTVRLNPLYYYPIVPGLDVNGRGTIIRLHKYQYSTNSILNLDYDLTYPNLWLINYTADLGDEIIYANHYSGIKGAFILAISKSKGYHRLLVYTYFMVPSLRQANVTLSTEVYLLSQVHLGKITVSIEDVNTSKTIFSTTIEISDYPSEVITIDYLLPSHIIRPYKPYRLVFEYTANISSETSKFLTKEGLSYAGVIALDKFYLEVEAEDLFISKPLAYIKCRPNVAHTYITIEAEVKGENISGILYSKSGIIPLLPLNGAQKRVKLYCADSDNLILYLSAVYESKASLTLLYTANNVTYGGLIVENT